MNKNLNNLIFAHRGIYNNTTIPENSILSFTTAINKKKNIELDIHITKDDKLVVFHDFNLFRICKKNKLIKNCTASYLTNMKLLNTHQTIPLLSNVLDLVNGKVLINIEIKNTNKKKKTLDVLYKLLNNYNGKYIIQTFYPEYLLIINRYYNSLIKGLLVSTPEILLDYFNDSKFSIKLLKPDFLAYNKELVKSKKIQLLREKLPIFVWTIKNEKEFNSFSKFADSFIMNFKE